MNLVIWSGWSMIKNIQIWIGWGYDKEYAREV
jgi:hypothetical protein